MEPQELETIKQNFNWKVARKSTFSRAVQANHYHFVSAPQSSRLQPHLYSLPSEQQSAGAIWTSCGFYLLKQWSPQVPGSSKITPSPTVSLQVSSRSAASCQELTYISSTLCSSYIPATPDWEIRVACLFWWKKGQEKERSLRDETKGIISGKEVAKRQIAEDRSMVKTRWEKQKQQHNLSWAQHYLKQNALQQKRWGWSLHFVEDTVD